VGSKRFIPRIYPAYNCKNKSYLKRLDMFWKYVITIIPKAIFLKIIKYLQEIIST
jgi:hypothetical protein